MIKQTPEWFVNELQKTGRLDREDRNGAWIICPNPNHSRGQERTGSLHVNLTKEGIPRGNFNCLGCGYKGPWNVLAEQLKMKQLKAADKVHAALGFSFQQDEEEIKVPLLDPNKLIPWPLEKWRTINKQTLLDFSVRATYRRKDLEAYIPVYEYKKLVGGIYAKIKMTDEERAAGGKPYLFTDGAWKNKTLFGFDKARKRSGHLWIVEGARDALKVYQLGGRVVATLGANLSIEQKNKIDVLDPELIIIATDPDSAGDKLTSQIESYFDNTVKIDFPTKPKKRDPAQMNQALFDRYMAKINKLYGEAA